MSQMEHVGNISSLFCRCNKNSVSGSSSWDVWKIRYCAVHQPLFNKLIFKRWCYSVNDTGTLWEKRTQSAPISSRTYFLLVIPQRFIRLPWRFASTQFILLGGRGTVRGKCFAQEHNTVTWPGLEPRPLDPSESLLGHMHLPHLV